MIKRLFITTIAVFIMTSLSAAMEIGGVHLPDTLMAGKSPLLLNGAGLRKKVFIKVYAGGLYL
ncbi:MAG: chalcone isomerase family protein, partial [Deltaproteobacteria bacterium]|nr:chalcone isomerase family protein [Deltaproteobacteria bacterium]